MKRFLLLTLALMCGACVMAQDYQDYKEIKMRRPKYVNLGYVLQQDVTLETGDVLTPKFGATINRGRTFYLHKRPIANFLNFGIDATWIDANYAMYKPFDETSMHQAELALQVGPSITMTPAKRLQIHLYGRFAPTFALRYDGEVIGGNYASMFLAGGNVSFGFFGIGAEYRKGSVNYKPFNLDKISDAIGGIIGGNDDEGEDTPSIDTEAMMTRASEADSESNPLFGSKNVLSGLRVYVTFRF